MRLDDDDSTQSTHSFSPNKLNSPENKDIAWPWGPDHGCDDSPKFEHNDLHEIVELQPARKSSIVKIMQHVTEFNALVALFTELLLIAIGTLIFTFMFSQDIDRALVDSISAITTTGLYQVEAEVFVHAQKSHKN